MDDPVEIDVSPMISLEPSPADDYWSHSREPLVSLVLVTPLLVFYELGVLLLGPEAVRNGVDVWLRQLLGWIGFGQYFLLPALTVTLLLAWHYASHAPWRISKGVLGGMVAECCILAVLLVFLGRAVSVFVNIQGDLPLALGGAQSWLARPVAFAGAGIYEELLFRLMLLPAIAWLVQTSGTPRQRSFLIAAIITSILFSAAHYVGTLGDPFTLGSFVFRFLAGIFFSLLFVYRGFGIAAGTHAGYDILVGMLLARA